MKLYRYKLIHDEDSVIHGLFTPRCTEEYIKNHYWYIGETAKELPTENISVNGQLYRWCASNRKCNAMFYEPYYLNDKDKWNKEIENQNNPICPVCGYVDYDGWECPSGEYKCPRCHSTLELSKRYNIDYDNIEEFWYKTKLVKRFIPKKVILEGKS